MSLRPAAPPTIGLPGSLEATLHRLNPWWQGKPHQRLPPNKRHLVHQIRTRLKARLAPIVVVRGARQIGKTTAQLHVLEELLQSGVPGQNILRVQFDELPEIEQVAAYGGPILRIVDWFEREVLRSTLNQVARDGQATYLFFDEVQNLNEWAVQLKALVDSSETHVVVTGSSALRIAQGRDSLAGRLTMIEAGVLSLTEIAAISGIATIEPRLQDNGIDRLMSANFWRELRLFGRTNAVARDAAFSAFSSRGGYPLCHARPDVEWSALAEQLNEIVIKRVIQHDLRVGERGRKRDPQLLEELFRVVCRYAGQAPAVALLVEEMQRSLGANVGPERVRAYLRFLGEALLIRVIDPLEIRLKRRRGHAKLCLVDHGLRASWLKEIVPLDAAELALKPDLATIAGHLAESVLGATLSTISGLNIAHLPAKKDNDEVDFVLVVGERRIPIEVKYQARPDPRRDPESLRRFIANQANRAEFGLIVTRTDDDLDYGEGIIAIPLSSVMLLR
jgi:predicted AAA+ superfamily ATPase